jgi:hypothetical protein
MVSALPQISLFPFLLGNSFYFKFKVIISFSRELSLTISFLPKIELSTFLKTEYSIYF